MKAKTSGSACTMIWRKYNNYSDRTRNQFWVFVGNTRKCLVFTSVSSYSVSTIKPFIVQFKTNPYIDQIKPQIMVLTFYKNISVGFDETCVENRSWGLRLVHFRSPEVFLFHDSYKKVWEIKNLIQAKVAHKMWFGSTRTQNNILNNSIINRYIFNKEIIFL